MNALDMILVAIGIGIMALGFFVMKRLDRLLNENKALIKKRSSKSVCILPAANLKDRRSDDATSKKESKRVEPLIPLYRDDKDPCDDRFYEK